MNPLIIEILKTAIPMMGLEIHAKTLGEKYGPKITEWADILVPQIDGLMATAPQWRGDIDDILEFKRAQIVSEIIYRQKAYGDFARIADALEVLAGISTVEQIAAKKEAEKDAEKMACESCPMAAPTVTDTPAQPATPVA